MTKCERQQAEIATIKERTIMLKLSDADVKKVFEKAGSAGLTVPELLQNFIGDLVDGTYSNGSDERDYAEQWFDRCWFGGCSDYTFLRFLIEWNCLDDILAKWSDIKVAKDELVYATEHPDECEPEETAYLQDDIACWTETIQESFSDFKKGDKENKSGTLEQEMEKVLEWHSSLDKALNCPAQINDSVV